MLFRSRGDQAEVAGGSKDAALAPGEKFYIVAVGVGSDVVSMGLYSLRSLSEGAHTGRVWMTLNFFFPRQDLDRRDAALVIRALDRWISPEGAADAGFQARMAPPPSAAADLKPGMSKQEIVSAMGPPMQEVDRKSTRLNSSHIQKSRMPSSA